MGIAVFFGQPRTFGPASVPVWDDTDVPWYPHMIASFRSSIPFLSHAYTPHRKKSAAPALLILLILGSLGQFFCLGLQQLVAGLLHTAPYQLFELSLDHSLVRILFYISYLLRNVIKKTDTPPDVPVFNHSMRLQKNSHSSLGNPKIQLMSC